MIKISPVHNKPHKRFLSFFLNLNPNFCLLPSTFCLLLCSCTKYDRTAPEVSFVVKPELGDSLTMFYMDASGSTDDLAEPWQLQVRWDAESDGSWDTDYSLKKDFAWRYGRNGSYTITCEVRDGAGNIALATSQVTVMPVMKDSSFTDSRDGQEYRAVYLFGTWWLAENLRYGLEIGDEGAPKDDGKTEFFARSGHPEYGGYYLWDEVAEYGRDTVRGICPDGWRLPRPSDLAALQEIIYFKTSTGEYILTGGRLGLDFTLSGRYVRLAGLWEGGGTRASFWISNGVKPARLRSWALYRSAFDEEGINLIYEGDWRTPGIEGWLVEWGSFSYVAVALPVRCIKSAK